MEDFSGHQLLRIQVDNEEQAEFLVSIRDQHDFWTEVALHRSVDIHCSPNSCPDLLTILGDKGMKVTTLQSDLGPLIKESKMKPSTVKEGMGHTMDWTDYHPIEDMHSYMDFLEATYDFVTTESIGSSYEGSDMRILKVCRGECGNKPAMWIDGGIHAREWISPASATFMMKELVENDAEHPDLTQDLDWYILPVVNPDGYLYTQTDKRLWRKTRSPNGGLFQCYGTDANRNWGFHWGTGGSSTDKCSDTYMGSEAFSEVENRNVRDFLLANKEQIKFYNNIHSYSQLVLLPWGWGYEPPTNFPELQEMALLGAEALKAVHGMEYEVGCIPCMLYVASGGSLDWTLGVAGIPYSYGMELRDTGASGFLLPPEQIIPTGEEVWAFHLTIARKIAVEFGPK